MKTKWFAIGCFVSIILAFLFIFGIFFSLGRMSRSYSQKRYTSVDKPSYLHLKISGQLAEYNEMSENPLFDLPAETREIIARLQQASTDENIIGLVIEPGLLMCGYSTLHELNLAIEDFRESGKKVYACLERAMTKDYLLAARADSIFLTPSASAGIMLSGIGGSILFYKDLLDKLGIEFTMINAGEYKGAGETLSRRNFSPPVKKNLEILYDDVYRNILADLATARQLTPAEVRYLFEARNELFINQQKALDYRLVDGLMNRDQLTEHLGISKKELIPISKYRLTTADKPGFQKIAVVYAQGEISEIENSYSESILSAGKIDKIITSLEKDSAVKAIVLRVNSPGGSALESEKIHARLSRIKSRIPLVVSMGNIAASGGYYISAPADYIFADPFTITGSIGVAALFPNFQKMGEKIGLSTDKITRGKFNNLFDPWNKPDPNTMEAIRQNIEDVYREFKARVAAGRSLPLEEVEILARGQVWSSSKALDKKLIDATGTLQDAIDKAAELAGLVSYKIAWYPKKLTLFEKIFQDKFGSSLLSSDITSLLLTEEEKRNLEISLRNIRHDPVQSRLLIQIRE